MWHSKDYKKEFNKARAQETIVLESVHKHQARILDHSYKDLCHTLQKREESFNGTETSVSANKQSSNIQAKTDALIRGSVAAEALPCSSSVSLLNSLTRSTDIVEGTIDETLESAVDDKTTNVKQMAEEDQELSDTEEGISFAVFTEEDRKVFAETYLKLQHTVTLPSGSRVEDVLFTAGVTKKRHHLIHSLIVDVDDESTKSLFTPTDWDFIKAEQEILLEIKDKDILDYRHESAWKLGRQMHDIFRARTLGKTADASKEFRTYGLAFGGATAQIHVMTSLGGAVTVLRRRSPLMLAQSIQHIHENITILEIFLLMKQDIVRTLAQDRRKFSASDLFKGSISRTSSPLPASFSIPLAHPSPKKRKS
ncbi:hypothetical protein BGX23_012094 [Mortierella sp. AD031]|nr:hypothetical protein BGX23_012094 [Mortierella sp. AD031]